MATFMATFMATLGNSVARQLCGNFWQLTLDKYLKTQRKSGYFLGNFFKISLEVAIPLYRGRQLATFVRQLDFKQTRK